MNKTTKNVATNGATNGNGTVPSTTRRTKKVKTEFLPLIPMAELKKKEKAGTLTPEEALMMAWQHTYKNRHKRIA